MTSEQQPSTGTTNSWATVAATRAKWNAFFEEMTAPVNDWLCDRCGAEPGKRILDLACGTGHPALSAARRVRPDGTVVGIDIASEMVEAATELAHDEGLDNTEFRVMNAETLDFPDASFDGVTSRWGIMFPEDVAKTCREVYRVLKPSGRVSFAFWDDTEKNPRQGFMETVIRKALAEPPRERGYGRHRLQVRGPAAPRRHADRRRLSRDYARDRDLLVRLRGRRRVLAGPQRSLAQRSPELADAAAAREGTRPLPARGRALPVARQAPAALEQPLPLGHEALVHDRC